MKPRHRWQPELDGFEVCVHCGIGKKSLGRHGTLFRRPETGATWHAAKGPDCTGPKPDPNQPRLF